MKLFECQFCGQPLHFENTHCESCGHQLGFSPPIQNLSAVEWIGEAWTALADPSRSFRFCANAEHDVCNWLIPADNPDRFCVACRHNRVIPNTCRKRKTSNDGGGSRPPSTGYFTPCSSSTCLLPAGWMTRRGSPSTSCPTPPKARRMNQLC